MADLAGTYRSLAALHRAGLTWPAALEQVPAPDETWHAARRRVSEGAPLSDALGDAVAPLDLALLRAGEARGALDEALEGLASRHEEARRRRGALRAALAYPVLVAHLAALLLGVPDLIAGRPLAALGWVLLLLVPVHVVLWRLRRSGAAAAEHDAWALDALGALHDAGVPLSEALPLARAAGPGGRVAADLADATTRVARGLDLAGCWRETPPEAAAALRNAERAGALGRECRAWAERWLFDLEMRRKATAARLAPLMVLGVGAIVGVRVISFYAGIYGDLARY
jgi:type II secretory pathway component PulF